MTAQTDNAVNQQIDFQVGKLSKAQLLHYEESKASEVSKMKQKLERENGRI